MSEELSAEERGKEFIKRYGELVAELDIDFATFPLWEPDGNGGFTTKVRTQPMDMRGVAKKSPFVADDEKPV